MQKVIGVIGGAGHLQGKVDRIVYLDELINKDRGITISNIVRDSELNPSLALDIRNYIPFQPPITRAERRKNKRKKVK